MALRTPITPPPAQPPRYSLITVAAGAGLSSEALYHGWTFDPEVCGSSRGGISEVDDVGANVTGMTHPGNPGLVTGDPFIVWASDEVSTLGLAGRDWLGRATRMLQASESYWLAREFSTGSFGLTQRSLNDAGATVASVSAVPAAIALALVERELGQQLRGSRGMIHVTEDVLDLLVSAGVLTWDTTAWVTPMRNLVVADAGYTGAAPGETDPDAGESWLYGTSLVSVALGEVTVTPASAGEARVVAEMVARSVNTATVFAGRLASWVWDECAHVGAPVDLTIAGDGGGGGTSGAATALTNTGVGDDVAVADAETLHGWSVYNNHASDAILLYLRHGDDATDTPFEVIAVAAGQSVNVFSGAGSSDGIPITGGAGLFMTDESSGSATVDANLIGHIVTGAS